MLILSIIPGVNKTRKGLWQPQRIFSRLDYFAVRIELVDGPKLAWGGFRESLSYVNTHEITPTMFYFVLREYLFFQVCK